MPYELGCGGKKDGLRPLQANPNVLLLLRVMHEGSAACHSKASKQARRVERKLGFIPDAGNWWGGWRTPVQRPIPHPGALDKLGMRAFTDRVGGGYMRNECRHPQQSSLKLAIGGGTSLTIVAQDTGSIQLRVHSLPFLCRQFSGLWRLKSWVQSAHPVLHLSPGGFRVRKSSQDWLRMLSTALEKEPRALDYA